MSNTPIKISRKPCSSIAKHIIETRYRINVNTAFRKLGRNCQGRVPGFIKALGVSKSKHPLCVRKLFVFSGEP